MHEGDWVTSYSKGLFKIEKIVKRYYDESHVGGILLNIGFSARESSELIDKMKDIEIRIIDGMTYSEIKEIMNSDLTFELPYDHTLQIINFDFEINENKQMIFRAIRMI